MYNINQQKSPKAIHDHLEQCQKAEEENPQSKQYLSIKKLVMYNKQILNTRVWK